MKLKDLLMIGSPVNVTYRTFGPNGEDLLAGYCFWDGASLVSRDGDTYDVEDEINGYVWSPEKDNLTVWYESKWVYG